MKCEETSVFGPVLVSCENEHATGSLHDRRFFSVYSGAEKKEVFTLR